MISFAVILATAAFPALDFCPGVERGSLTLNENDDGTGQSRLLKCDGQTIGDCHVSSPGVQCCEKNTNDEESNCHDKSENNCDTVEDVNQNPTPAVWCTFTKARALSRTETAGIVVGSVAGFLLLVYAFFKPKSGVPALYVAYYIPIIVAAVLLMDPDFATPFVLGSDADARFRIQVAGVTVIVIASAHLVLGGLEARSKTDEKWYARWRSEAGFTGRNVVNIVADAAVAVSLGFGAQVTAHPGTGRLEQHLAADDCIEAGSDLWYCGETAYTYAWVALIVAAAGNLFCIAGRFMDSDSDTTPGYNLLR